MKHLNLTETTAYTVRASTDDRSSGTSGIYSTYAAAGVNCKGAGWWGSDGEVELMKGIYTDGEKLYQVKFIGEYTDKSSEKVKDMLNKIKEKLTPEEWAFYNENLKTQTK